MQEAIPGGMRATHPEDVEMQKLMDQMHEAQMRKQQRLSIPQNVAPTDLSGYVLIKKSDLVSLVQCAWPGERFDMDKVSLRVSELTYAYPREE